VLLTLTAGLFDQVPLERMTESEKAVRHAISRISPETFRRVLSSKSLDQEDREMILRTAEEAITQFPLGL
jgi:F-type H+/Na+-transporting ATPase subunit alpha